MDNAEFTTRIKSWFIIEKCLIKLIIKNKQNKYSGLLLYYNKAQIV